MIARDADAQPAADLPARGTGALTAKVADKQVPLPLLHTDVRASVSGYIGTVDVVQQFQNPYDTKIEVRYAFPLPHNAAVNEFIMTIGSRRIRGIIRERKDAEQIYEDAKRAGYMASLLTEDRHNIFTQTVANIESRGTIDVSLKYFQALDYVDGWYQFVFPMAQPKSDTNAAPARAAADISLRLEVEAGMPIEEYTCRTHKVAHDGTNQKFTVALDPTAPLPNRDFVLRYRVAGSGVRSSLLTHRDTRGGYFTLMIYPPEELASLARQPLELVFVLDCSASMSGTPLAQAKAAVERGLRLLRAGDSFQLINFSTRASQLGTAPLEATPENVERGLAYLRALKTDGESAAVEGIKAALDFPHDGRRLRFVCFLTDGQIGNEEDILAEVHKRLGDSRIFSFGAGPEPNRYLLNHLAKAGGGALAYLGPKDDGAKVMEQFFSRISHPALTDLKIDWGAMQVTEVFPRRLPDVFAGRPIVVTGRYAGKADTTIRVTGSAANLPLTVTAPANLSRASTHIALPSVWARMKIADLVAESTYAPSASVTARIKSVALDYNLLSPFTAFIAVDTTESHQP